MPFTKRSRKNPVSLNFGLSSLPDPHRNHSKAIFEKLQILVVDDHEVNRSIVSRMIELLGATPSAVESGQQALDMLDRQRFDIVLMDCRMPDMDGLETTRRIRAKSDSLESQIPIVAMTANAFHEDRESCFAAGMNAFLCKSLNIDELTALIHDLIADKQTRQVTNETTLAFIDPRHSKT